MAYGCYVQGRVLLHICFLACSHFDQPKYNIFIPYNNNMQCQQWYVLMQNERIVHTNKLHFQQLIFNSIKLCVFFSFIVAVNTIQPLINFILMKWLKNRMAIRYRELASFSCYFIIYFVWMLDRY